MINRIMIKALKRITADIELKISDRQKRMVNNQKGIGIYPTGGCLIQ